MRDKLLSALYIFLLSVFSVAAQQPVLSEADSTTYDIRSGLSHWIVSDILQDRQGFIWFATWNGLNRFDGYEFSQIKVQPGDGTDIRSEVIRQAVLDEQGDIVCGTDAGLYKLNLESYKLENVDDREEVVFPAKVEKSLFLDHESNLWKVGRYGVTKIPRLHNPAKLVRGTEHVQARAFFKDEGRGWWLASKEDECIRIYNDSNALIGYLGRDGRISREKVSFGYRAYHIFKHSNGDIWIGCKPGALLRLREQGQDLYEIKRIALYDQVGMPGCDIIYHMAEDDHGRLWVASFGGGVYCLPDPTELDPSCFACLVENHATTEQSVRNKVRRILLTDHGNIVCATTNGVLVAKINQEDVRKTSFCRLVRDGQREASLCNNATMDVCQDKEGTIFIATENNGIDMITEESLFSEEPSFVHFNRSNSSLTSDACLAMAMQDDECLFVVCSDRVLSFNPAKDQTITYSCVFWNKNSHFSEERPLRLSDGSWLFGQEQGAFIASLHSLHSRGYIPPLLFTSLHINGMPSDPSICLKDTLIIRPNERNFSLSFAALDYTDNSGICYRTRMNHSEWSRVEGSRTLTFFDLQPGMHQLSIQSTDRYGRWIDNTRTLHVMVLPHWYETMWAKLLGGLAVIIIITMVVAMVFYMRNLQRQRRELLERYMALLSDGQENNEHNDDGTTPLLDSALDISDRKFLERVTKYIEENISNSNANIDDMASQVATSRSSLNRKLRSLVGVTANQLLIEARMQKARQLLQSPHQADRMNITDVAFSCGYADARYFSRCFKQKYGVTPTEFASNN